MAKKKGRGNGTGTVYPRRNKQGKIIGYRGSYWVQSGEVPKRHYVRARPRLRWLSTRPGQTGTVASSMTLVRSPLVSTSAASSPIR
jgi:hypothetical protein